MTMTEDGSHVGPRLLWRAEADELSNLMKVVEGGGVGCRIWEVTSYLISPTVLGAVMTCPETTVVSAAFPGSIVG